MFILDQEQETALKLMRNGKNVFLTGSAGTGKSAVIDALRQYKNRLVCLAPTGLAARNLRQASTIHAFFSIGHSTDETALRNRLRAAETILIDEISMVRVDLFQRIDRLLRLHVADRPFGGKQIIVVGDFHQLPPVAESAPIQEALEECYGGIYAFNAPAWEQAHFETVRLNRIHRQTDRKYINFLEALRATAPSLPDYLKLSESCVSSRPADWPALCCTRHAAALINAGEMNRLAGEETCFNGKITGRFPIHELPVELNLKVIEGARMMLLANRYDTQPGGQYVNGDIGVVSTYSSLGNWIEVLLDRGGTVRVTPTMWSNCEYEAEVDNGELELHVNEIGYFRQFPLIPAYATTIHKAQGQTIPKIHLVLGKGCFAPGQLYTALSRVRSFADLTLDRPIRFEETIVDPQIQDFLRRLEV